MRCLFSFHATATTAIYTLSLHDALPICRGFAVQRLMNAMRQAHADGWFIVFDTLTFADDRLEAFYDNPNALRDYFRDIGRMVLAARSEERRVGKECRSRWSPCPYKKRDIWIMVER